MTPPRPPGFVCFCGVDWWYHSRAHSDVQLMLRLARSRTVLLVNSIGMRTPRPGRSARVLHKFWRKAKSTLRYLRRPRADLPGFWVMTPLMLPPVRNPVLRRLRSGMLRLQVGLVARCLGLRQPVLVVTVPTAWDVVRGMPRHRLVYNRSDRHAAFPEADRTAIEAVEGALLDHADVVLYAARALMEAERGRVGERARLLEHGLDLQAFAAPGQPPPALAAVPRPRVGFFGGLREHLVDFALLERVARELPEAQLVLIGEAPSAIDALRRLPNVHWLGAVEPAAIPACGAAFDVALMPYRDNEWIRYCSPIKMREYLALGLPVISTDFPAARELGDVIDVAATPEAFVAAVRRRLAAPLGETERAARRRCVADASWDRRAEQLLDLVG